MSAQPEIFTGAFASPVFDAQAVFRTVMDCMARPGTVGTIVPKTVPPQPLGPTAGALALALTDHDTPVWLTARLAKSGLPQWLAFHTGATVTDEKQAASFAFVELGAVLPSFSLFAQGTAEYPDRSTTLVVEIAGLTGGAPLLVRGPGIKDTASIALDGLPETFLPFWTENHRLFPRGVDLVLVAGADILCLPRTTAIQRAEV